MTTTPNPYVGPYPFSEDQHAYFFGREQETKILSDLVMARRVVLFFAKSGVGKSSLLQAGLRPELNTVKTIRRRRQEFKYQKMRVLGVTILGRGLRQHVQPTNIYILSVLLSLEPEQDPMTLAKDSLTEGLKRYFSPDEAAEEANEFGENRPTLLIFDQFEELFTLYPDRVSEREDFFRQVNQALAAYPSLHVLFSMREDYIAELTPYAALLPDNLKTRRRLKPLNYQAALDAVRKPAEKADLPFASGVAESLVQNLAGLHLEAEEGEAGVETEQSEAISLDQQTPPSEVDIALPPTPESVEVVNAYTPATATSVEPVHLQIVCYQLWQNLPEGHEEILMADVQKFGDVDEALIQFYETALQKALNIKYESDAVNTLEAEDETKPKPSLLSERALRRWFSQELITPARTKNLVYRDEGQGESAGLPNPVVESLYNNYLIRAEVRSGDTWYEIAHDRLIEPILAANRAWIENYHNPLAQAYSAWQTAGRIPEALLAGYQLRQAERYDQNNPHDVTPDEADFLAQSQHREAELAEQKRLEYKRQRNAMMVGLIVIVILAGLGAWSWRSAVRATNAASTAETAEAIAQNEAQNARSAESLAQTEAQKAQIAEAIAEVNEAEAKTQASIAATAQIDSKMRALSSQSSENLASQPDLAFLLAFEADQLNPSPISRADLRHAADHNARIHTFLEADIGQGWALAYNPAGTLLAAGGTKGQIVIWDTSLEIPQEYTSLILPNNESAVYSLVFSADGQYLIAGYGSGQIILWPLDAEQEQAISLIGHQEEKAVFTLAVHQNTLASAGKDGIINLWNLETRALKQRLYGHTGWVWAVKFSPDGQTLASGGHGETIYIWDVASGQRIGPGISVDNTITSLDFDATGQTLVSGDASHQVHLWDVPSQQELRPPLVGLNNIVWAVAFDSRLGQLFAPDGNKILFKTTITTPSEVDRAEELVGHTDNVKALSLHPTQAILASLGEYGRVVLWNIDPQHQTPEAEPAYAKAIWAVAFDTEGQILASGGADGLIKRWAWPNILTPTAVFTTAHTIYDIAFSPDGSMVATGPKGSILLWSPGSSISQILSGHTDQVVGLTFNVDGSLLASSGGENDSQVIVWNMETNPPVSQTLTGHKEIVWDVAFHPDGEILASSGSDHTVKLWNLASGNLIRVLEISYNTSVPKLMFNPEGSILATGEYDDMVLWDTTTWQPIGHPLRENTGFIWGLSFDPRGEILASADGRGYLHLWDVASRRVFKQVLHWENGFRDLAFHPQGDFIVAGDSQGNLVVWDIGVSPESLCQQANRNFSQTEWVQYFPEEPYRKTCPQLPLHPSLLKVADDLARAGNRAEAIQAYQNILTLEPDLNINPQQRAKEFEAQYQVEVALSNFALDLIEETETLNILEGAAALAPSLGLNPALELAKIQAEQAYQTGKDNLNSDLDEALKNFNLALTLNASLDSTIGVYLFQAALAKVEENEIEAATRLFTEAQKFSPDLTVDAEAYAVNLANERLFQQGHVIPALYFFSEDQQETYIKSLLVQLQTLSLSPTQTQKLDTALLWYETVQADETDFGYLKINALYNLCWQGMLAQQAEAVLAACNDMVDLLPEVAWPWATRGLAMATLENYPAARLNLEQALSFLKQNPLYEPDSSPWEAWYDQIRDERNGFTDAFLEEARQE